MSTATVDQWKIVCWKWQGVQRIEGKVGTSYIFGRKGCLCYSANWIGYNKSFCNASWYFSMGQTTMWQHCPSCVTTRCCHEGPGSPLRANDRHFAVLHGLIVAVLHCTYGHTNLIQMLHNWSHSGGTAVEHSVHQTLSPCGSGLAHETSCSTISHAVKCVLLWGPRLVYISLPLSSWLWNTLPSWEWFCSITGCLSKHTPGFSDILQL